MRMRLRLFLKAIQGTIFDHPLSHLVPTQKVVNRKGKTHLQTYFVNPAKHAPKAKKQDARALLPAKEVRGEQMGLPLEPTPVAEPPQPAPAPSAPPSPAPQRGEEPGYMSAEKKRALAEAARVQFGNFSVQGSDIPYDAALAAHNGTSWSPEHRAHLHQREWVDHFSGLIDRLAPLAKTEEQRAALEQMLTEHARRRKEKVLDYLAAKSRVASPMIAGPANFPFESNQKRIEAEMRKLNELSEFDERAEKAMRKRLTEMGEPPLSEVQRYERKLAHLERLQEMMKNLNAAIRRAGGKATPELEAEFARYGLSSADMHKRLTPDFAGRIGFHDYELKNNSAEIRRVRALAEAARAKEAMAAQQSQSGGPQPRTVKGVQVVEDAGQDRLRLIFPGKPAPEVIAKLKARGFRWSPSNGAWQRQLTNAARQAAQEILAGLPGEEPPEPKAEQGQPPAPRPKVQPEHLEEARKLLRQGKLKIGDRYRDVGLKKEHKGFTSRGEEIWGYPYSPEHFIPSDATGKPLRYYVTLPNGAVVHPDELERLRYNPSTGRYEMPSDEGLFVVYPNGEKLRRKNAVSAIGDAGINRFPSDTLITVRNSSGLSVTLPKSEWFKLATGPFHAANENAPTFVDWAEQSGLTQQGGAAPEADTPPQPP
ncbi:hypothetical protein [Meiothermus sp. Pnk-1]|uniref:hypothetical protein n=1 Tax=Meiothermus sp. Pnk-1 TaxID=873128 RepID=UPI0011B39636|nr:hypothetical protein [Meiothermus sp. Pnk-1]